MNATMANVTVNAWAITSVVLYCNDHPLGGTVALIAAALIRLADMRAP
jgi:hypothetical protein